MKIKNSPEGFTLIELLAVIVIIAIIALIGVFSVTKIMAKVRINALSETAMAAKRAVGYHVNTNDLSFDSAVEIELFDKYDPRYVAGLYEVTKDPWGQDYIKVYSSTTKVGDNLETKIYLLTQKQCYVLNPNSDEAVEDDGCRPYIPLPANCYYENAGSFDGYSENTPGCPTFVTVPNGITKVSKFSAHTSSISGLYLPNGITSIEEMAFSYNSITELVLPNTLISIGSQAFSVNNIPHIVIPDSVTYVGPAAFNTCGVETLTLSNNLTSISQGSFAFNHITNVVIPPKVTNIGVYAFSNNLVLETVTLPTGLVSIEYGAFNGNNIKTIVIPSTVTTIGAAAFTGNSNLTKVIIRGNVRDFGTSLANIFGSGPTIEWIP